MLAAAAGGVAGSAALLAAAVIVVRRCATTLDASLLQGSVLAVAAAGVLLVALADAALKAGGPWQAAVAARIGLGFAVAAVALPVRARDWGDAVSTAVAILVAIVAAARWPAAAIPPTKRATRPADSRRQQSGRPRGRQVRERADPVTAPPGHLRQRFARYELPAGGDCVRGRINLAVSAGAKTAHGHVGFCPAFAETPAVTVTTDYDGVEAIVTAAEVLPWGVRIECRLMEPAEEPLEIPVDLVIQSIQTSSGAA